MMMEVFNQCAPDLIQDDPDEEDEAQPSHIEDLNEAVTLAQELMGMMSEKENSSSVNVITQQEALMLAKPS